MDLYEKQKILCYQLVIRWKRFISSKNNIQKDDLEKIGKIYRNNIETETYILSKLEELKREAEKFHHSKEVGLDWKTPLKQDSMTNLYD